MSRVSGEIIILDVHAPVYVVTFSGSVSDQAFENYLAQLTRLLASSGARALVFDARTGTPAPASQRQRQAQWIREHQAEVRRNTAGIAFVLSSAIMRGALTAIMWLAPLPCPHHITPNFEQGMRWARERLAEHPATKATAERRK
jgi:hypothetical protein